MAVVRTATWFAVMLSVAAPLQGQWSVSRNLSLKNAFHLVDEVGREASPLPKDDPSLMPPTLDVHVAVWAPTALLPAPLLRLTRIAGQDLRPELYVWWIQPANVPDSVLPSSRCCMEPGPGAVCVAPLRLARPVEWARLLVDVYASRVCALDLSSSAAVTVVSDAGDLSVSIQELSPVAAQQDFSCVAPRGRSRPGASEAARTMDLLTQLVDDARRAGW